jgi:hypothetical protein
MKVVLLLVISSLLAAAPAQNSPSVESAPPRTRPRQRVRRPGLGNSVAFPQEPSFWPRCQNL